MTNKTPEAPATSGIVLRRAARWYDLLSPPMTFWQEGRINRRLAVLAAFPAHAQILDVGCATGRLTRRVAAGLNAEQGGMAIGLDASPEMVAIAAGKSRGFPCRFDLGLAESLPYADARFDGAVSSFFFHHLDRALKLRALTEIHRVLRPGSSLWVADLDKPWSAAGRLFITAAERFFRQPEIRENAEGVLTECFPRAGFRDIRRIEGFLGCISLYQMYR